MNYDPALPPDPSNTNDPRNEPGHPENPNDKGGGGLPIPGGGGVVLLAIVYFVLLLSTVAAVSAIIAAPVLRFYGKLLDWDDPPGWGASFTAAFFGFFAFFLVGVFQVQYGGLNMYDAVAPPLTLESISHSVQVFGLPILACAAVIWWRMSKSLDAFAGVAGFVRSLVASVLCWWVSTALVAGSVGRAAGGGDSAENIGAAMLGLSFVCLAFAVVGGVVAAIPLAIGTRIAARGKTAKPGLLRTYFTAVLVLLVWIGGSLALEFFFNTLDPVYFYFKDEEVARQATVGPFQFLLPYALGFLFAQLTAVGLAGRVLAWRLAPTFKGRAGWVRASMLAFVGIAVTVAPLAIVLAALAASGRLDVFLQYF